MTHPKKQLKITKLLKRPAKTKVSEDCDELQEEIQALENRLQEKQNELFQLQRNSYRLNTSPPQKKDQSFVRPQKIVLNNSIESLKRNIELMSLLTGVEVQSYIAGTHCCIVYHMQHNSNHVIKHGLKVDMNTGGNVVSSSSLPLGFNLNAVMEEFDNIMKPSCLGSIRKALVAYYNRLEQFESLKALLIIEADLFKVLDASHIQITFLAQRSHLDEEDERIIVKLILDYRVYDIRPKTYSFKEKNLPEGVAEILRQQCLIFKKKPLHKAFREAFIDGVGTYKLVQQMGPSQQEKQLRKLKRPRVNNPNYNIDDTFQPEDCSDQGEEEQYSE